MAGPLFHSTNPTCYLLETTCCDAWGIEAHNQSIRQHLRWLEHWLGPQALCKNVEHVDSEQFLTDQHSLESVAAGSILIGASFVFEDSALIPRSGRAIVHEHYVQTTPRLWRLLNLTVPVILIMIDGGDCTFEWPRSTHHLLYRTTWCNRWHSEFEASFAADMSRPGTGQAWLRSLPFGTALDAAGLRSISQNPLPSEERPFLFNFRGSLGYRKPSRSTLLGAWMRHRTELSALADRAAVDPALTRARSAPGSHQRWVAEYWDGVGSSIFDIVQSGSKQEYQTSKTISYIDLLRESKFTLAPP